MIQRNILECKENQSYWLTWKISRHDVIWKPMGWGKKSLNWYKIILCEILLMLAVWSIEPISIGTLIWIREISIKVVFSLKTLVQKNLFYFSLSYFSIFYNSVLILWSTILIGISILTMLLSHTFIKIKL